MPRMERMTRILLRRTDLVNLFFCYLHREFGVAHHCQPERQFPQKSRPAKRSFYANGSDPIGPNLRGILKNLPSLMPARGVVKKTAPLGAVWLITVGRAKSCYSRSIELPKL